MERLQFKITIDAPRERVWEILWGSDTYPQWTSGFAEGSNVETDWIKGSRILFVDGKGNGMISVIEENIPNEFMSFKHLGVMEDGKENFEIAKERGWVNAIENYTLKSQGDKTELTIDQDVEEEYKDSFIETWPKALSKLKTLSETKVAEEAVGDNIHARGLN